MTSLEQAVLEKIFSRLRGGYIPTVRDVVGAGLCSSTSHAVYTLRSLVQQKKVIQAQRGHYLPKINVHADEFGVTWHFEKVMI